MHHFAHRLVVAALLVTPLCLHAQSFVSSGPASPDSGSATVKAGNGKQQIDLSKRSDDQLMTMNIHDATLVVDGLVTKIHLDYKLDKAAFMYFYLPGEGTVVVSRFRTPDAVEVKHAFHGDKLSFSTGGHEFELDNTSPTLGRGSAWVRMDNTATALGRYPMMGYGLEAAAPYAWPLALPAFKGEETPSTNAAGLTAPRIPRSMLPNRSAAEVTMATNVPPDAGTK
jgi:hypothetical protein